MLHVCGVKHGVGTYKGEHIQVVVRSEVGGVVLVMLGQEELDGGVPSI